MQARYLFSAALLGGVVSFGWGFFSHAVLPGAKPASFADSTAVVQTVKANAPANGIYFDGRGLFAVVAFRPDLSQKFTNPVLPMAKQLVIEIAVALVLAWVLLRLPGLSVLQTAILLAIVGLAAAMEELLPMKVWFGFPRANTAMEAIDLIMGWFLLGAVLGWLRNKMVPVAA